MRIIIHSFVLICETFPKLPSPERNRITFTSRTCNFVFSSNFPCVVQLKRKRAGRGREKRKMKFYFISRKITFLFATIPYSFFLPSFLFLVKISILYDREYMYIYIYIFNFVSRLCWRMVYTWCAYKWRVEIDRRLFRYLFVSPSI